MPRTGVKILKRIIIAVLLITLLLAIPVFVIQYLKGDKVKQLVVAELNKHLTAEISVREIDISVIKSFPYASLVLHNVLMKPPADIPAAPGLLRADKIWLKFNVLNFFYGKYTIHSVSADNAVITIYEADDGKNNYTVWKSTGTTGNEAVSFNIEKLTLASSKIFYHNVPGNDQLFFKVNTLALTGVFEDTHYNLKVKADCFSERLSFSNKEVIKPGAFKVESVVDINTIRKFVKFSDSRLTYSGIDVALAGLVNYSNFPEINFVVTSLTGRAQDLVAIIPDKYTAEIRTYNPKGTLSLRGTLKGKSFDPSKCVLSLNYTITKGIAEISGEQKRVVEEISAEGSFFYSGKPNSEVLSIGKFAANVKSAKLSGNCQIRNFDNPSINLELHAKGKIEEFADLIKNEEFSDFKGNMVADIKYNGVYRSKERIDRLITGQAVLTGAGFKYKAQNITDLNGATEFRDNKIFFNGLTCQIGSSDIKANGYIQNLTNYLFDNNQPVFASLRLHSEKIVLDDLLNLVKETGSKATSESIFPKLVSFDAVVSVNSLNYKKLITQNITGTFSLKDNVLRGQDIMIKALDGNISANGVINGRYGNRAQIITTARFKDVDINKLFYQFNEFGQKSLLSKNLKGKADALVDFSTSLRNDYTVNQETVEAVADIEIRNGELNDYEPLQALSRFLDADELSNVRFATLNNRIEISKRTIFIPKMEIKSSAMDLIGYGTHTFDNQIDYHVNMLLADVLKAKRKRQTDLTKYVEDDGSGKPRLFLKMTGPIDDPLVQYDTKAVRNKIADDLKKEKQVFKEVIRKEFGRKEGSTTDPETKTSTQQSPEFQIEWDELK